MIDLIGINDFAKKNCDYFSWYMFRIFIFIIIITTQKKKLSNFSASFSLYSRFAYTFTCMSKYATYITNLHMHPSIVVA